jgi:hypothetical protein
MKLTGILARMKAYSFMPDYNDLLAVQIEQQELIDALRVISKFGNTADDQPIAAKVAQAALDRME